jgi:hypothetical protein
MAPIKHIRKLSIFLLLVVLALTARASVRAAEAVTINQQTVTCGGITLTYTVTGAADGDYALLYAHRADGTEIAFTSGPGTSGQHTVTIPISPAEPAGTPLYGRVSVGIGDAGRVQDQGPPTACGSGGGDGGDGGGDSSDSPAEFWPGFTDGRLNPDVGEYYSVWCNWDRIDVYRTVPQTELLKMIPLADVLGLGVGGTMDLGDFMVLARQSEDGVTIYGSNGNHAPEPGQKSFSLAECIERNGGAPEASPQSTGEDTSQPPAGESGDEGPDVDETVADCFSLYSDDPELLTDCLAFATGQEGASGLQILWVWIFQGCLGLPIGLAVGLAGWRWRRRFVGRL